jgi:hypothetical protein
MNDDSSRLGPVLFAISLAGSLLLIGLGIFFACNHARAAEAYGVPVSGGPDNAWISSAASRDVAFGGLTLAFALLRDRRAVGLCLLFGAIIPIGDGIVVLRDSPTPLEFLPLHWGGAAGCLLLAVLLLRPRNWNSD